MWDYGRLFPREKWLALLNFVKAGYINCFGNKFLPFLISQVAD
jgi:hypothetical protein